MSELKDYDIMDIEAMDDARLEKSESGRIQVSRVYFKSEADLEIARQKHRRCLAMAKWCFTKSNYHYVLARHGEDAKKNCRKSILYSKWHRRWLTIADKFKTKLNRPVGQRKK